MRSASWSTALAAAADGVAGRPLTEGEHRLARAVFGAAVRLGPVRLQAGGFGRFAVTIGSRILVPPRLASCDFALEDVVLQAFLVHELVHVWQFQTRPLRTLASWAWTVATGGYGPGLPGYRYARPAPAFDRLNLERQASVVEHAFLLGRGVRVAAMPAGLSLNDLATPFPVSG